MFSNNFQDIFWLSWCSTFNISLCSFNIWNVTSTLSQHIERGRPIQLSKLNVLSVLTPQLGTRKPSSRKNFTHGEDTVLLLEQAATAVNIGSIGSIIYQSDSWMNPGQNRRTNH
jgi:hypothetical protein